MKELDNMMEEWRELVGEEQFPPKYANEMIQVLFACKNIMSPKQIEKKNEWVNKDTITSEIKSCGVLK